MARCHSCSAPLPADTGRCSYCGTRNDLDLAAISPFLGERDASPRICPECDIPLATVQLALKPPFAIERCDRCYGLFFDPGEIQAFLEAAVATPDEANFRALFNINQERGNRERPVRYLKCPICAKHMNRVNFGYMSGVVMDQCKQHGVWLDNGDIVHLMEWKRAGGQLLDQRKREERRHEEERHAARRPEREPLPCDPADEAPAPDLFDTAYQLLRRLFG